jgi:hypothetical protein
MQASVNAVEALWIVHPVIEIPLAGIMYWRKLHRQFPIFFAYILFQVAQFVILFPLFRSDSVMEYFLAYWISAIACWVFGFKIIHEIFSDVFRFFPTQKDMGMVLFRWAALVTAGLVLVLLASTAVMPGTPLGGGMIAVERGVRFTQCALILFLLLFSGHMGVSWRQHSIGIALGFVWFAGVELVVFVLYSGGAIQQLTLNLLNLVAYSLALIVWITYAAFPATDALPNFRTGQNSLIIDGGTF